MIEDELRALLADRAGELPDNARRVPQVRSRIRAIRRRRATGAALALVLLAIAGVMLTRLPGRPDALPTGVPAGPWFTDQGVPVVPGYVTVDRLQIDGPKESFFLTDRVPLRYLILVRCERRGAIVLRNLGPSGPSVPVDCSRGVRSRFEGVAVVEPDDADRLFAEAAGGANLRWEPGTAGRWDIGIAEAAAPDRLPAWAVPGKRPAVEGADDPDGTTITITVPRRPANADGDYGFGLSADCVLGVRLILSVPTGTLATLDCDEAHGLKQGNIGRAVTRAEMARLGLRAGDRVELTVRSVGKRTDQWRLWPIER